MREALAIEREEAVSSGKITFLGRLLIQCTLPHRDPGERLYQRTNGAYKLTILAPPDIGLPWGRYPRLILPWLTTEAVRTKSPIISLGRSLSDFMGTVGVSPCGGRQGTMANFRDQAVRLFASTIVSHYRASDEVWTLRMGVADESRLWWRPSERNGSELWGSYVHLTESFFASVVKHPVPLDARVLRVLRAPLAIDLYAWITFRMSYLRARTAIPWSLLALQFGGSYEKVKHFRAEALKHLLRIRSLYPDLRIQVSSSNLILLPSPPHIKRKL
jgi:hypothetical protein